MGGSQIAGVYQRSRVKNPYEGTSWDPKSTYLFDNFPLSFICLLMPRYYLSLCFPLCGICGFSGTRWIPKVVMFFLICFILFAPNPCIICREVLQCAG